MSDKKFTSNVSEVTPDHKSIQEPNVLDEVAGLLSELGHDSSFQDRDLIDHTELLEELAPSKDRDTEKERYIGADEPAGNNVSVGEETEDASETAASDVQEGQAEESPQVAQQPIIHHTKPSKLPTIMSSLALLISLGLAGGLGYERYLMVVDEIADTTQLDEATSEILKLKVDIASLSAEVQTLQSEQSALYNQVLLSEGLFESTLQEYLKNDDFERQLDRFNVVTDIKEVEQKFQESLLASLELASAQSSVMLDENKSATKEWVSSELESKIDSMLEHVGGVIASLKLDSDRQHRDSVTLKSKIDELEGALVRLKEKKLLIKI